MQIYIETKKGVKIDKNLYERLMLEAIIDLKECTHQSHHDSADETLCELLIKLGFEDVVEVYNKVPKWYS